MTSRPCPRCTETAPVELGAGYEATVSTVAGTVGQLPRIRCSAGHLLPATADPAVLEGARATLRATVPYGRARSLRRGESCVSCGQVLSMPVRRTEWPVTFDRPGGLLTVVTVRLDVPATRCPGCGVDHVPTRSQGDLEATVEALLRAEL